MRHSNSNLPDLDNNTSIHLGVKMLIHGERTRSIDPYASAYYHSGSSASGYQTRPLEYDTTDSISHQHATNSFSQPPPPPSSSSSLAGALGPVEPRSSCFSGRNMRQSARRTDGDDSTSSLPGAHASTTISQTQVSGSAQPSTLVPQDIGIATSSHLRPTDMFNESFSITQNNSPWASAADQIYHHQGFNAFEPGSAMPFQVDAAFANAAPDLLYVPNTGPVLPFMSPYNQWDMAAGNCSSTNMLPFASMSHSTSWPSDMSQAQVPFNEGLGHAQPMPWMDHAQSLMSARSDGTPAHANTDAAAGAAWQPHANGVMSHQQQHAEFVSNSPLSDGGSKY